MKLSACNTSLVCRGFCDAVVPTFLNFTIPPSLKVRRKESFVISYFYDVGSQNHNQEAPFGISHSHNSSDNSKLAAFIKESQQSPRESVGFFADSQRTGANKVEGSLVCHPVHQSPKCHSSSHFLPTTISGGEAAGIAETSETTPAFMDSTRQRHHPITPWMTDNIEESRNNNTNESRDNEPESRIKMTTETEKATASRDRKSVNLPQPSASLIFTSYRYLYNSSVSSGSVDPPFPSRNFSSDARPPTSVPTRSVDAAVHDRLHVKEEPLPRCRTMSSIQDENVSVDEQGTSASRLGRRVVTAGLVNLTVSDRNGNVVDNERVSHHSPRSPDLPPPPPPPSVLYRVNRNLDEKGYSQAKTWGRNGGDAGEDAEGVARRSNAGAEPFTRSRYIYRRKLTDSLKDESSGEGFRGESDHGGDGDHRIIGAAFASKTNASSSSAAAAVFYQAANDPNSATSRQPPLLLPSDARVLRRTGDASGLPRKPVLLFDLNGVLVQESNYIETSNGAGKPRSLKRKFGVRPGIHRILLLRSTFHLGVFSSAQARTVNKALTHILDAVQKEAREIGIPPALVPRELTDLFSVGFCRDHCVLASSFATSSSATSSSATHGHADPPSFNNNNENGNRSSEANTNTKGGINPSFSCSVEVSAATAVVSSPLSAKRQPPALPPWATFKPLARLGLPLSSLVLVDNEVSKVLPGEEANLLLVPTWEEATDSGTAAFDALVDALLSIPDGADLRQHCGEVSSAAFAVHSPVDYALHRA